MSLGSERTTDESLIASFANDSQLDPLGLLQIAKENAFKLAASVGILGKVFEPLKREREVSGEDFLLQRLRTPEEALSQLFDLPGP